MIARHYNGSDYAKAKPPYNTRLELPMLKRPAIKVILLTSLLLTEAGAAQTKERLLPLAPAERTGVSARLDPALLPHGAGHLKVDPKQVFNLVGGNGTELTVVPVVFTLPLPDAGVLGHTCGVYVVPAHGATYFLDGSPDPDQSIQCWQILAVRLARKAGQPPDIVITGADSLTTHSWSQDYVLSRKGTEPYRLFKSFDDAPGEP